MIICIRLNAGQVVVSGTNSWASGGEKHAIKNIWKHPDYTGEKDDWKDDKSQSSPYVYDENH